MSHLIGLSTHVTGLLDVLCWFQVTLMVSMACQIFMYIYIFIYVYSFVVYSNVAQLRYSQDVLNQHWLKNHWVIDQSVFDMFSAPLGGCNLVPATCALAQLLYCKSVCCHMLGELGCIGIYIIHGEDQLDLCALLIMIDLYRYCNVMHTTQPTCMQHVCCSPAWLHNQCE